MLPPDLPASADLTIDLDAVVANYQFLARQTGASRCAGVVKADAYGLGAARVAPALHAAGCREFFVATLPEGLALQAALPPDVSITVLNGLVPGTEAACAAAGLIPVLNSLDQCRAWAGFARPAVLQVDTGMSRLGLDSGEQAALLADQTLLASLELVQLMSHLANADAPEHPSNQAQLAAFNSARQAFPGLRASLANSAGIFLGADYQFDLCRPGAALYGISAGPKAHGIKPVVTLQARIAQIRTVTAGTAIGYGYAFTAPTTMRVATIGVGYADGWPRALSGKGAAWCDGQRLPMLGRVSMDSFAIDISALPADRLTTGDAVELLGPHQSADAVASAAGTIGYEILTSLGHRYQRHYVLGGEIS